MKFKDKPCCHLNCVHRSICIIHKTVKQLPGKEFLGTPRQINEAIAKICCKFERKLTEEERANIVCGKVYSE